MPRKIRLTERRALLMKAREDAELEVARHIAPVFKKQFKKLERFLRRSNLRKRIEKMEFPTSPRKNPDDLMPSKQEIADMKTQAFFKQEGSPTSNEEEWEKWKDELTVALLLGLFLAINEIGRVENKIMVSRGREELTFDAEALILAYQLRTGERIDMASLVTMAAVERIISEWFVSENDFSNLIGSLKRYFNDTRIDTLSRTLVGDLHAQMIIQQMNSYGLTTWYWDHKGEDIPCISPITMLGKTYHGCKGLNGKVFRLGDPMPPNAAHPNCVLPGQIVSVPGLLAGTKSFYRGIVIEIRTGSGRRLSVTPNHPILTSRGWVAAQELSSLDNVICHSTPRNFSLSVYPDYNHIPSLIEDVFRSLEMSVFSRSMRVPISPVDFHGDGERIDGDINIVYPYRKLVLRIQSLLAQGVHSVNFTGRDVNSSFKDGHSSLALFSESSFSSPSSNMGSFGVRHPLLFGHVGVSETLGVGKTSRGDVVLGKNSTYNNSGNMEFFSQSKLGGAGLIKTNNGFNRNSFVSIPGFFDWLNSNFFQVFGNGLALDSELTSDFLRRESAFIHSDKVTNVSRVFFTGHVYDLQSVYGLYTSNGIITHNCHCLPTPDGL